MAPAVPCLLDSLEYLLGLPLGVVQVRLDHGLHVVDYDAHSFAAGYRYRMRLGPVRPFVRLLAGFSIITDAQGRAGYLSGRTKGGFMLQPGAGVDIPVAGRAALRFQADVWHFLYYRFSAGLSFDLGGS